MADDDTAKKAVAAWMAQKPASGGGKERMEAGAASGKEPVEVEEIPTEPEVEKAIEKAPELAGYIEKVEKAAELTKPVTDDYTNQVLLGSANPQQVTVKLPLTEEEVSEGLHHKVWEGIRWLAEWCVRQVKKFGGMVTYK